MLENLNVSSSNFSSKVLRENETSWSASVEVGMRMTDDQGESELSVSEHCPAGLHSGLELDTLHCTTPGPH